jgi:hypothetical protein
MKKTILLTACIALTLGGCAEMDTKPAAAAKPAAVASPELDKTIADAEKEIAAAKKVGIWRDTEKFLDEAKKAKAEGKTDEAMKKAKLALKQAQLAQKQMAAEAANGKPYFPK